MSEDYNEAALRHYRDAEHLADDNRIDNAAHLIGFAAECAIKHAFDGLQNSMGDLPRIHLPDLANAALKRVKSKSPKEIAFHSLLRVRPKSLRF